MTEGQNISLLEKIVADQRKILAEHMTPALASDPEVWALYKEVQALLREWHARTGRCDAALVR